MLAVQLQVPSDDEEPPCYIVDEEYLNQIVYARREYVLDPHFCPKVDHERLWLSLEQAVVLPGQVLELRSALDNNVVREQPH